MRWRDYRTRSGRRPVKDFIDSLDDEDAAAVVAAMNEVRVEGLAAARHLDIDCGIGNDGGKGDKGLSYFWYLIKDMNRDFLDEVVEERTARNPDFPHLVDAAARRRRLLKELAEMRESCGRTQTAVAAEMNSSQSSVARLEGSAYDARLSTIDRYAEALGFRVQWHLLPLEAAAAEPPVVVHDAPSVT